MHKHSTQKLKTFTRELRDEAESRAERRIWKTLLSKRQTGERFLRQQPIENEIAGFFCPDLNLVVEIGGKATFSVPNYNIVTFSEEEVINQLDEVAQKIKSVITAIKVKKPSSI